MHSWYFIFLILKILKAASTTTCFVAMIHRMNIFFVYLHWRFCYHIFIWDFGWQLIWCIIFMGQIPKYLVLRCTQKNSFWVLVLSMQSGVYDELCYSHKLFFELSEGYYIIILFISCCHFFLMCHKMLCIMQRL